MFHPILHIASHPSWELLNISFQLGRRLPTYIDLHRFLHFEIFDGGVALESQKGISGIDDTVYDTA